MLATKDLWIIGDKFLHSIFDTLQSVRDQAKDKKKSLPYIYETYNVTLLMDNPIPQIHNLLARLLNCLIKGLNNKSKLPRMIVIMPDWDILRFMNHYTFGVSIIAGKCLNWIITNMERAIEARKDELHRCKPGAVQPNEPKMIWVKMINRSSRYHNQRIFAVRKKFNTALEELLCNLRYHYILEVSECVMSDTSNFTYNDHLIECGRQVFGKRLIRHSSFSITRKFHYI